MKTWNAGDLVNASDLNANFNSLLQVTDIAIAAANTLADRNAVYIKNGQIDGGIVYNNKANFTASQAAGTFSNAYTVGGGNNRMLVVVVAFRGANSPSVTGVTYNGVSMTQIDNYYNSGSQVGVATYLLYAPASGSHTLGVITGGGGANSYSAFVYDYANVAQTNTPNGHAYTGSAQSLSITPTVVNCLVIGHGSTASTFTAGLPNNQQSDASFTYSRVGDSGVLANMSAVSYSWSGNNLGAVICLAPFSAPSPMVDKSSSAAAGTATTFIGFVIGATAQAATAQVRAVGVIDGLSGLIAGSPYYLADTAGTISVTPGTVTRKVGMAISATQLLITNVW
jgi:hypothetical protein